MQAAVQLARQRGARRVIVAVPVGAPEACDRLTALADRVICLVAPTAFIAVGYWYDNFTQTDDDEVRRLLRLARLEQEARAKPEGAALTG